MSTDDALFAVPPGRLVPGRVRKGLDADAKAARGAGVEIPAGMLAAARSLADQLDAAERSLRAPSVKPWDRVPLTQLARTYQELYRACFPIAGAHSDDPIGRALEDFMAGTAATAGDAPGPGPELEQ